MTNFTAPAIAGTLATLQAAEAAAAAAVDRVADRIEESVASDGTPLDLALLRLRRACDDAEQRMSNSLSYVSALAGELAEAFASLAADLDAAFAPPSPKSPSEYSNGESEAPQPPLDKPGADAAAEEADPKAEHIPDLELPACEICYAPAEGRFCPEHAAGAAAFAEEAAPIALEMGLTVAANGPQPPTVLAPAPRLKPEATAKPKPRRRKKK